jgi:hypothetical protein
MYVRTVGPGSQITYSFPSHPHIGSLLYLHGSEVSSCSSPKILFPGSPFSPSCSSLYRPSFTINYTVRLSTQSSHPFLCSVISPGKSPYAMKAYGVVDVYKQIFLSKALLGGEWSASRPSHFISGERATGITWIGSWVDTRAGLDDVEKWRILPPPGLESPTPRSSSPQLTADYAIPAPNTFRCISDIKLS